MSLQVLSLRTRLHNTQMSDDRIVRDCMQTLALVQGLRSGKNNMFEVDWEGSLPNTPLPLKQAENSAAPVPVGSGINPEQEQIQPNIVLPSTSPNVSCCSVSPSQHAHIELMQATAVFTHSRSIPTPHEQTESNSLLQDGIENKEQRQKDRHTSIEPKTPDKRANVQDILQLQHQEQEHQAGGQIVQKEVAPLQGEHCSLDESFQCLFEQSLSVFLDITCLPETEYACYRGKETSLPQKDSSVPSCRQW